MAPSADVVLRKVDGKKCSEKAMALLGTTPTQLTLMKTLGVSSVELEKAVEDVEVHSVDVQRKRNDKEVIKQGRKYSSKGLATLGVDPSFYTLQKQLGLTEEELILAIEQTKLLREFPTELEEDEDQTEVPISATAKNAITKSQKLQKILGTNPQHVRLMRLLGATEQEIQESLAQNLTKQEKEFDFASAF